MILCRSPYHSSTSEPRAMRTWSLRPKRTMGPAIGHILCVTLPTIHGKPSSSSRCSKTVRREPQDLETPGRQWRKFVRGRPVSRILMWVLTCKSSHSWPNLVWRSLRCDPSRACSSLSDKYKRPIPIGWLEFPSGSIPLGPDLVRVSTGW